MCLQRTIYGGVIVKPMSTIIFRAHTEAGFVVGSDGLAGNPELAQEEFAQKIWCFETADRLIFSFTGSVELGHPTRFDFRDVCERVVSQVKPESFSSLKAYLEAVCAPVNLLLRANRRSDLVRFTENENERRHGKPGFRITNVLVDGYFRGVPSRADACFWHESQQVGTPDVNDSELDCRIIHGSKRVHGLFANDARFAQFREMPDEALHPNEILSKRINDARRMIAAQGSEQARGVDEICNGIGGKTQIAVMTLMGGFAWVKGFEGPSPFFPTATR